VVKDQFKDKAYMTSAIHALYIRVEIKLCNMHHSIHDQKKHIPELCLQIFSSWIYRGFDCRFIEKIFSYGERGRYVTIDNWGMTLRKNN
jgi:hypothetical protein